MTVNWEDPAEPQETTDYVNFDARDHNGELLIIEVHEVLKAVNTKYGDKDVPRCTVTVVDGDQAGATYEDARVWGIVLFDQLAPKVGTTVLARMSQGVPSGGNNPPWKLEPAGDADKAKAEAFLAKRAKGLVGAMAAPNTDDEPVGF